VLKSFMEWADEFRLGITYPEITEMQARATFEAVVQVAKEGVKVIPEVMISLIGGVKESENQKKIVVAVAEKVLAKAGPPGVFEVRQIFSTRESETPKPRKPATRQAARRPGEERSALGDRPSWSVADALRAA
jgi:hypothetical protein